jgi:patatin-like phospholipase/acyl hydrolase
MFNELLLVAYEYNSHHPRLYSKYFSKMEPNIHDVKFSLATGGSSAAPIYFDP